MNQNGSYPAPQGSSPNRGYGGMRPPQRPGAHPAPLAPGHPGHYPPPPMPGPQGVPGVYDASQPYGQAFTPGVLGEDWEPAQLQPVVRSTGICILLYIVTIGIYGLYWAMRVSNEHPTRRSGEDKAGWMAWLMLIPLFNFIWGFLFYLPLTDRFNRLGQEFLGDHQPPINRSFCLWWRICEPLAWLISAAGIGAIVLSIMWWLKVNETANRLAEAQGARAA